MRVLAAATALLIGACATPERELWEAAGYECRGRGGVISVDVEKKLCFCLDGTVCDLR